MASNIERKKFALNVRRDGQESSIFVRMLSRLQKAEAFLPSSQNHQEHGRAWSSFSEKCSSLRIPWVWCTDSQQYELRSDRKPEQWFRQGDEQAFACWLAEHSAFSFVGRAGRLSVRKEGRGSGKGYWYAYRKQDRRIRKGYLGPSAQMTFARLEEQARSLASSPPAPPLARDLAIPSSRLPIPLLATRLAPPRLPLWLVERARLLRDLDAIYTHPLTLASASAGGGKTTLLSAWVTAPSLSPSLARGDCCGMNSSTSGRSAEGSCLP